MTTTMASEPTTYRWSSTDEADRFGVEDPATGEVITIVQGGGSQRSTPLSRRPTTRSRRTGAGVRQQSAPHFCSRARRRRAHVEHDRMRSGASHGGQHLGATSGLGHDPRRPHRLTFRFRPLRQR
jgi:hypothetical protein